jgi:IS605 OrfB family transposase
MDWSHNNNYYSVLDLDYDNVKKVDVENLDRSKSLGKYWGEIAKLLHKVTWLPEGNEDSYISGFTHIGKENAFCEVAEDEEMKKTKTMKEKLSIRIDSNEIGSDNVTYTKKVRFYPTKLQKEVFRNCCIGANYYYNKTISYLMEQRNTILEKLYGLVNEYKLRYKQANYLVDESKLIPNFRDVRNKLIIKVVDMNEINEWEKLIPSHVKATAIQDAFTSFDVNIKKHLIHYSTRKSSAIRNKTDSFEYNMFEIKERTKLKSFAISYRAIFLANQTIMPRLTENDKFHIKKRKLNSLLNKHIGDSRVVYEYPNRWFLCLSMEKPTYNILNKPNSIVTLDPGVRTFQTFYSPQGIAGKIGNDLHKKIYSINTQIDNMQSCHDKSKASKYNRKRRNLRRKMQRLRNKIHHCVNDLHKKTASYLVNNFSTILIPKTNISDMVKTLPPKVNRNLLALSHYKFRSYLKFKASYTNCNVLEVSEAYTSKTCASCGIEHTNLGGDKIFTCPNKKCSYELDRDIHGARNIYIRNITQSGLMNAKELLKLVKDNDKKSSLSQTSKGSLRSIIH